MPHLQICFKKSYEYELRHFVGAVRGNHNIISTGEDALKVMEIADAIYKSAKIQQGNNF